MNYTDVNKNLQSIIEKFPFIWDSKKTKESKVDVSDSEKVEAFSNGGHGLKKWADLNTIEKEKLINQLTKYDRSYGETALAIDLIMHGMKFPGLDKAPTPAQLNEGFSVYADEEREQYDTALNKLYYQLFNGTTHQPQTKPAVLAADLLKTIGVKNEDAKKLIERLDKETISKTTTTSEALTALHLAMAPGDEEIAEALIKKGVDVNIKNEELATPLHYAALYANPAVLPLLFENKADVNAQNKYGLTPLDVVESMSQGKKDEEKEPYNQVITKLREAGGKTKAELEQEQQKQKDAQLKALGEELLTVIGKPDGQKRALEIIEKLDAKHLNETKDKDGHSALHCAANIGNTKIAEAILNKPGINIEIKDNGGNTPLHQAAYNGKAEMVQLLIEKGANKESVDKDGNTPLMDAISQNQVATTQKLVDLKANVNAKNTQIGLTAFEMAKTDEIKNILINAGVSQEIEVVRRVYEIGKEDYEKMQKKLGNKKPKEFSAEEAHKTVVDWATNRNQKRPLNRLSKKAYDQAIKNIKKMEELGLLAKGPAGVSNAEVYLYRLHQSRLFYSPSELIKHSNGEFVTVDKALGSESGVAFRTVFKDLTSKELTDDQLKDYARTVEVTEGCVNNFGQCRTTPKIPMKGKNASYNQGATHNIGTASETLTKKGKDITQAEYDISKDLNRKKSALVSR